MTSFIQTGGRCHVWQSPDGSKKHIFLLIDSICTPDYLPGVVILTDPTRKQSIAMAVKNLQAELPTLRSRYVDLPDAYWSIQQDSAERARLLWELTFQPVYVG